MTTAHRPTWNPAKGGNEQGGFRLNVPSAKVSARDMPGHLTLKERGRGQGAPEDLQERDLKRELEEKEERHRKKAKTEELEESNEQDMDADVWLDDDTDARKHEEGDDMDGGEEEEEETSDQEEDELLKELERIKREREEERRQKEEEERVKRENFELERAMRGNPLLNIGENKPSFKVKRRWDDDVVFRKQNDDDAVTERAQGFINDTVRNEFHRKFLERYIK